MSACALGLLPLQLCRLDQPRLALLAEPVALALNGQRDAVVEDAVEDGSGEHVVAEDLAPLSEGLVAGDEQRAAFVAAADELED